MPYPLRPLLCLFGLTCCVACASPQPATDATASGQPGERRFTNPASGLDLVLGRSLFERIWVSAPASTQAADGLGPLYNARACSQCHTGDARLRPPVPSHRGTPALVMRAGRVASLDDPKESTRGAPRPDPVYGAQMQPLAIGGHDAEFRLAVHYTSEVVQFADGTSAELRRPRYTVEDLGYGPLHPDTRLSPRIAPPLIGLGLLEAVDERDILARADPDDRDGDGISGRPNRVVDDRTGKTVLGRFGHKAGSPSVNQQVQQAFARDLGIAVPLYPDGAGDCTAYQLACRRAPHGKSPQHGELEADDQVVDLVSLYARRLAVPARPVTEDPVVDAGRRLFGQIGCDACHTPHLHAPAQHGGPTSPAYSDLLLHDLGEDLADGLVEGGAGGREWRTAPLWGIGLSIADGRQRGYLHDGRARSPLEAVLWHGGEAQRQRDAVVALSTEQRNQLIKFVESL